MTKHAFNYLTPFIVILFITSLSAQEMPPRSADQPPFDPTQEIRNALSPRTTLDRDAMVRSSFLSIWNSNGTNSMLFMPLPENMNFTQEQTKTIFGENLLEEAKQSSPAFAEALKIVESAQAGDDPLFEKATEKQKQEYAAASLRMQQLMLESTEKILESQLTPEQLNKIYVQNMHILPELGFPTPAMYNALDLTDEQKAQMLEIKKQLEPEFLGILNELVAVEIEQHQMIYQTLDKINKETSFKTSEEFETARKNSEKSTLKNEALLKKHIGVMDKGKKLASRLQLRLMNVLTDAQLDKMQAILDNPSKVAREIKEMMKTMREDAEKSGQWIPQPGAWQPGDGVPKKFKEDRKAGRFPQLLKNASNDTSKEPEKMKTITPREAYENMKTDPDLVLIDVRNPDEFKEGHAKGAKLIPLDQFDPKKLMDQLGEKAKDKPVYFICRSGRCSAIACEKMISAGFSNVINVEGGTLNWIEQNLPKEQ